MAARAAPGLVKGAQLLARALQAQGVRWISTLGPVDFAAAAQAFGALGTQISTRAELAGVLRQALRESLPALIHAPIAGGMPGE